MLVFECEDRHVICLECFGVYSKGKLNERQMIADPNLGKDILISGWKMENHPVHALNAGASIDLIP